MFEHKSEPLLSRGEFYGRMARHGAVVLGIVAFSLFLGSAGYHYLGGLPWIDALLNASMILGGMGPVNTLHSMSGKLFASAYALYAGIVFILTTGILGAPFVHRFLHRFHLEMRSSGS